MISFHDERMLKWLFGPAQALFERSPASGMIERHGIYNRQAIRSAGYEYGMPGRALELDDDGVERYRDTREPVYNAQGGIIGYHPAETVDITAETRSSAGYTPDGDALENYGTYSRRVLALGRIAQIHGLVFEAYLGQLGEAYAAGVTVEIKPKKADKPALNMGIETKQRDEPTMVRREGPGRIAALFHLTPSGAVLLAKDSETKAKNGSGAALAPPLAMRNLLLASDQSAEMKAARERMQGEAMRMLAQACAAWAVVVEAEEG